MTTITANKSESLPPLMRANKDRRSDGTVTMIKPNENNSKQPILAAVPRNVAVEIKDGIPSETA